jgi:hypothetical protein
MEARADSGFLLNNLDGVGELRPVYVSRVRIVRERGPIRRAYLPVDQTVTFGTHGAVREHYGTAPGEYPENATTLDYVVAATAG